MSQIRIANKQDEPHIRALVKDAYAGISKELDLDGDDADLKNIEWSYFGHDGVFFVLELNGAIAGVGGAAQISDDALEIKRLLVKEELQNAGIEDLLNMLIDFGRKMDYRIIECAQVAAQFAPPGLLEAKNFKTVDKKLVVNI